MNAFGAYSIPIQGLKTGVHYFKYLIDGAFFRNFEDTPIQEAGVEIELQMDKRADMLLLNFQIAGYVEAECDRCTATIKLPVESDRQLIVKYGEDEGEEEDEVVFISREAPNFNVAKYLYEFSILAMPIINTYNCQDDPNPPCNFEVLKYLKNESDGDDPNSIWDALKDLNNNN